MAELRSASRLHVPPLRLHFLGTGTSFGIPVIGCECATCRSPDPRDRRTRHAAVIESNGRRVLIDTPPELRLQLVQARIRDVDAVWYTHEHADHTHGVDDLRVFSMRSGEPLALYGSGACIDAIGTRFKYVFDQLLQPVEGTFKPEGELRVLVPYEPVQVAGFPMTPLPVPHGPLEVYGFRLGGLGYITDGKSLPERTRELLSGVDVLVLNALWFGMEHPTHFNVEEAVAVAQDIGAGRTFLTHISHLASHRELEERLPPGIFAAYDGLVIDIDREHQTRPILG